MKQDGLKGKVLWCFIL